MSEYEARQALQGIFDRLERKQQVRRGLLGDSNGTVQVANRPGWAYIRYHDNLNELAIVRYLIPDQFPDGMPVVVGRKHPQDPYEQVLGVDWAMYAWEPAASTVADHATQVITLNDLSMGKVVPTDPASLSVDVRAFLYVNGDTQVEFGGGQIDLTGNVPGVAGHRLVLVYMDLDADSLAAEDGAIVAVGVDANAPTVPENGIPLGVVDLENGEATIEATDISQYKALYLAVGEVIDLTQLSDYARGYIIRGGATDWEAYDAAGDGYALVGDGTDINSDLTPNWKGTHTWTVGNDEAIVLEMDAAQAANIMEIKDSGGDVTSGFDERGIVFSDGDTSSTNFFAGDDAGRAAATGAYNVGIGHDALQALTSGYGNVGAGDEALFSLTSGYSNIALGKGALYTTTDGTHSIAIGTSALYSSASDDNNTVIGSTAGYNLNGANRVIFIGRDAGFRQTNVSDRLLIDNQRRADAATELTHAIIYGTMGANPEDQQFTINVDSFTIGTDADSDVVMNWVANSNSGVITWMEDEDYFDVGDTLKTSAGRIVNTTRVTVAYTALVSDHMIFADTDGGAFTIDLPAGVEGQYLRIANVGTSGNDVTIDGDGAETVRGAATQAIADGEILILVYNATEGWW